MKWLTQKRFARRSPEPTGGYEIIDHSFDVIALGARGAGLRPPVNGYVTNLLVQLGYATVGQKLISLVEAVFFWVDGCRERRTTEN